MNQKNKNLSMRFDPATIEHLGIQMYSTLPPVVAELVILMMQKPRKLKFIYMMSLKKKFQ